MHKEVVQRLDTPHKINRGCWIIYINSMWQFFFLIVIQSKKMTKEKEV